MVAFRERLVELSASFSYSEVLSEMDLEYVLNWFEKDLGKKDFLIFLKDYISTLEEGK